MEQREIIAALIKLHEGLDRLGPGGEDHTRAMMARLPALPQPPRMADLGCGTGAAALVLARHFQAPVKAVDSCPAFLAQLADTAAAQGLGHLIEPIEADMGNLDWPESSLDLLWSEGAAYNLTFAGALQAWRPLLAPGGVAVISELSWKVAQPPEEARRYWEQAYPAIGTEDANTAAAEAHGYKVLGVHRLPSEAWWNYYAPLQQRIETLRPTASPAMRAVIEETDAEIALFESYHEAYGYTFYLLQRP